MLDIDGNGAVSALTAGLVYLTYADASSRYSATCRAKAV